MFAELLFMPLLMAMAIGNGRGVVGWKQSTAIDTVAGFLTNMTMRENGKTSYVSDGSFSKPDISLAKIFFYIFRSN